MYLDLSAGGKEKETTNPELIKMNLKIGLKRHMFFHLHLETRVTGSSILG